MSCSFGTLLQVVPAFEIHFLREIILTGWTLGQVGVPLGSGHLYLLRGLLVQLHLAAVVARVEIIEFAGGARLMDAAQLIKQHSNIEPDIDIFVMMTRMGFNLLVPHLNT